MAKTHRKRSMRKVAKRAKMTRTMRTMRTTRSHKRSASKNVKHSHSLSKSSKDDTTHKSHIIISNLEKKKKGKLYNINYSSFRQGASFNVH